MRRPAAIVALAAGLVVLPFGTAEAAAMQPYQMVRSLQLVQDRLADGDHAAIPMQRRLLEIIDERLRNAEAADFEDERNFEAIFIYGMSGGNPTTVAALLSRLELEGIERLLGDGIASYVRGRFTEAREALSQVDPMMLDPEVGAFVALVRGAVITPLEPGQAVGLLDQARLLSPGTLVEEAALRRSLPASAAIGDTERFSHAAMEYATRFLGSPYAGQFAEAFVAAIVVLHETIDLGIVEDVVAKMNDEQAHVIYLRLARKAAIEGYEDLLAFASAKAEARDPGAEETKDPRAVLYSSIASVTSENVKEVIVKLEAIDRARLSENDRQLLDAASAIAQKVLSQPEATGAPLMAEPDMADGSNTEPLAKVQPVSAKMDAPSMETEIAPAEQAAEPEMDATAMKKTKEFLSTTNEKLEAIDRLLEETGG